MSRKHYKALAAIVVRMHDDGLLPIDAHKRLVDDLLDLGVASNSRFDCAVFSRACGYEINGDGMWQLAENIR